MARRWTRQVQTRMQEQTLMNQTYSRVRREEGGCRCSYLERGQQHRSQEFVKQPRSALEKYLSRLGNHPVTRKSDTLGVFSKVQGRLPLARSIDVASRVLDVAARLPSKLF